MSVWLLIYLGDGGDKVNFLQFPREVFVLGQKVRRHHVTRGQNVFSTGALGGILIPTQLHQPF